MSAPYAKPWRARSDLATWWWACARYPNAHMAKAAWGRVERKTRETGDLGLYRHGPREAIGTLVTVVGLDRDRVERAARLLRDGRDEPLARDLVEAMVLRRARIVVDNADAEPGRVLIRRPDGAGAVLDERGHMHERPRGEG